MIKTQIKNKFNFLNSNLSERDYVIGDAFTLPDAYLFVMTTWLVAFKFDLNEWPNIKRYFLKLKERESIKKSLNDEGLQY